MARPDIIHNGSSIIVFEMGFGFVSSLTVSLLVHLFLVVDEEVLEHVLGDLRAAHVDAVAGVLDLSHALLQHLHLPVQLTGVRAGERKKATVYLVLQEIPGGLSQKIAFLVMFAFFDNKELEYFGSVSLRNTT